MGVAQRVRKTSSKCDLDFRYPSSVGGQRDYSGIPLVSHSNGTVCWEATDYLISYHLQNPGRAKSTLDTYARHLGRILSFLEHSSKSFDDVTDDDLFALTRFLQDKNFSGSGRAADNDQVNSILNRLIALLQFLSDKGYISANKVSTTPQVVADVNVQVRYFLPRGSKIRKTYFYHPARLQPKNSKKRRPITDDALNTLHSAIFMFSNNEFVRVRWGNLLQTLEHTGGRSSEIEGLLVRDVKKCIRQVQEGKTPRLRITTTKGKNAGKSRLVPVPEEFINELADYIEFYRAPLLKKYDQKHDYLFVTHKGTPLSARRICDHFRDVRVFAELKSSDASPHLCRNRFITLHVKERLALLMERHGNFRANLEEFVVKKVMLLTGHASESSLWGYVDDAIHELEVFKDSEGTLKINAELAAKVRCVHSLLGQAQTNISIKEKASILDKVVALCIDDGYVIRGALNGGHSQ